MISLLVLAQNQGAVMGPCVSLNSQEEASREDVREDESPPFPMNPASPEEATDSEGESDPDDSVILRKVNWVRQVKPRPDGSRTDIYYYEEGSNERLRSHNDIQKYCQNKGIKFNPDLFDFKGNNKFSGLVKDDKDDSNTSSVSLTKLDNS